MTDHETTDETPFGPTASDAAVQRIFDASSGRIRDAWPDSARTTPNAVTDTKESGRRNEREESA